MKYIRLITSSLGVITGLFLAISTHQMGWICATIWAGSCFFKDLTLLTKKK